MTVFEKCAKNVLDRCYGLKISPVKTLVHCDHWDLVTTRFTVRYYLLFSTHPLNNTVPPAMVVSGGQQRPFIFLIWSTHCRLLHFGNQQHQERCRQKWRNGQEGPCTFCSSAGWSIQRAIVWIKMIVFSSPLIHQHPTWINSMHLKVLW